MPSICSHTLSGMPAQSAAHQRLNTPKTSQHVTCDHTPTRPRYSAGSCAVPFSHAPGLVPRRRVLHSVELRNGCQAAAVTLRHAASFVSGLFLQKGREGARRVIRQSNFWFRSSALLATCPRPVLTNVPGNLLSQLETCLLAKPTSTPTLSCPQSACWSSDTLRNVCSAWDHRIILRPRQDCLAL